MLRNNAFHCAIAQEVLEYKHRFMARPIQPGVKVDSSGGLILPYVSALPNPGTIMPSTSRDTNIQELRTLLSRGEMVQSDMTLEDACVFASSLVAADMDNNLLYGVVWSVKNTNIRINPLHPLVAMSIILGDYDNFMSRMGTLTIYSFPDPVRLNIDSDGDTVKELKRWQYLLSRVDSSSMPSTTTRVTTSDADIRSRVYLNYGRDGYVGAAVSGTPYRNVVVPIQLYTKAMVYPYYGAILSTRSNDTAEYKSAQLVSMYTGNIRAGVTECNQPSSTCTGSYSNTNMASLYVMNNMALDSMYGSTLLPDNWYMCARVAMEISAHMFSDYFDLNLYPSDEPVPVPETAEPTPTEPVPVPETAEVITQGTSVSAIQPSYTIGGSIYKVKRSIDGRPHYGATGIRRGTYVVLPDGDTAQVIDKTGSRTRVMRSDIERYDTIRLLLLIKG